MDIMISRMFSFQKMKKRKKKKKLNQKKVKKLVMLKELLRKLKKVLRKERKKKSMIKLLMLRMKERRRLKKLIRRKRKNQHQSLNRITQRQEIMKLPLKEERQPQRKDGNLQIKCGVSIQLLKTQEIPKSLNHNKKRKKQLILK